MIYELAKRSDVFIENYVPGKLAEYGLDYESLSKIAPKLIYCSVTGYGSTGPYAKRPGYDVIAASVGGLLDISGPEGGEPCKAGVAMTDLATGLYAHGAILTALLHRYRTGNGQRIDVNLLSTQVACLINVASCYLNAGQLAVRRGTAHETIVPYEAFQTKSGYLTVGAGSDVQFKALCDLMDIPSVSCDPKYKSNQDRVKNRAELIKILTKTFKTKTNREWMENFEGAPFPVGPVNNLNQVFDDPHIKAIGLVQTANHSRAGEVKLVGPAVVYSTIQNEIQRPPPLLGEHTEEVLCELLGYTSTKINNLRQEGIVQ